jgi:hypothetical protein
VSLLAGHGTARFEGGIVSPLTVWDVRTGAIDR